MAERRVYAPSADKVVSEESDDPRKRSSANLFVDSLYRQMDESEHGPNAISPTLEIIWATYADAEVAFAHDPIRMFSMSEAYGAAMRAYLFQKELADATVQRYGKLPDLQRLYLEKMKVLADTIGLCIISD